MYPPPLGYLTKRYDPPLFWHSLSPSPLRPQAPFPPPLPQEKSPFPLTQSTLSRSLKYSISISNRPKFTFKRVNSTKKSTGPYEIKLGLRLTSEEFLKILAPISFQQTSKAFLTLNRSRILLVFCTFGGFHLSVSGVAKVGD